MSTSSFPPVPLSEFVDALLSKLRDSKVSIFAEGEFPPLGDVLLLLLPKYVGVLGLVGVNGKELSKMMELQVRCGSAALIGPYRIASPRSSISVSIVCP